MHSTRMDKSGWLESLECKGAGSVVKGSEWCAFALQASFTLTVIHARSCLPELSGDASNLIRSAFSHT